MHFRSKFLAWVEVPDFPGLRPASLAFEARHNGRYRYTRLQGQTPLAALTAAGHPLRFSAQETAPPVPLPKPEGGRYHLVWFIRSDRRLDVFGERFLVPPEAAYGYVVATIDVGPPALDRVARRGPHRRLAISAPVTAGYSVHDVVTYVLVHDVVALVTYPQ